MNRFEHIIGLMHGSGSGGSSLSQHVSAMRMDDRYAWTSNQLTYALTDTKKESRE